MKPYIDLRGLPRRERRIRREFRLRLSGPATIRDGFAVIWQAFLASLRPPPPAPSPANVGRLLQALWETPPAGAGGPYVHTFIPDPQPTRPF